MSENMINKILCMAEENGFSDLHLSSRGRGMFRGVDGLVPISLADGADEPTAEDWMEFFFNEKQKERLGKFGETVTTRTTDEAGLLRISACRQLGGISIAVRFLRTPIPSVKELKIPESVVALTRKRQGLILIAGFSGSGRTTTAAALLDVINTHDAKKILTLEKPVEYLYEEKKSLVIQRNVGVDVLSHSEGLISARGQDADVIFVSRLADEATVAEALTAVETGHLVIGISDAGNAPDATEGLVAVFPSAERERMRLRVANALLGVTAQQLVPALSGKGFGARVAAYEVLLQSPSVHGLICEERPERLSAVMQSSGEAGMQTMDDALYDLYMKSSVSMENAARCARDAAEMKKKLSLF